MKTLRILPLLMAFLCGWASVRSQDMAAEVPGDNFSLEGALELFKKSSSPEDFEKRLNSPDSKVNNLDLNSDGYIDYIRVLDRHEGDVHAFVLQAVLSDNEFQDVAVIELEKKTNGKAVLQIVGDEDVYGVETIIEPTQEVRTYAGTTTTHTVVNVWTWPAVRYVYSSSYVVWVSPWVWYHRPVWWHTWRPVAYVHYYTYWRPYRRYYRPCVTYRVAYAHRIYRPYRTTSVIFYDRHREVITRYRATHHDRQRYDRTSDGRSDYAHTSGQHTRDRDIDRTRRSQPEAHAVPYERRTIPAATESRSTVQRELPARRSTTEAPAAIRPRATTPTESRRQSIAPAQRPATVPQPVQTEIRRSPSPPVPSRRSVDAQPTRRSPSVPSVNRSRSSVPARSQARPATRSIENKSHAPRRGRD